MWSKNFTHLPLLEHSWNFSYEVIFQLHISSVSFVPTYMTLIPNTAHNIIRQMPLISNVAVLDMQTGDAYSSGYMVSTNPNPELVVIFRTTQYEHLSVISRFCLEPHILRAYVTLIPSVALISHVSQPIIDNVPCVYGTDRLYMTLNAKTSRLLNVLWNFGRLWETGRDLIQSYDKKTYTHRQFQ